MTNGVRFFMVVLGLAAFIAGLTKAATVMFAALSGILGITFVYYWSRKVYDGLTIKRKMVPSRVNFGEPAEYSLTLENRKLLPVPWLRLENKVTKGLSFVKSGVLREPFGRKDAQFQDIFGLKWYERVKRRYELIPGRRGLFNFGPVDMRYSGILGLFTNDISYDENVGLLVYPRILPYSVDGIEPRYLFGSRPRRGWLYTDPLNPVGLRPYRSTDSMRKINWKSSARHQRLESEMHHPSYDREISLFLVIPGGQPWWKGEVRNNFEIAVICAASVAEKAFQNGYEISFHTNGKYRGGNRSWLGDCSSRKKVMTALALLRPFGLGKPDGLLREKRSEIKPGTTAVLVSTLEGDELRGPLAEYARLYRLTVIWVGGARRNAPDNSEYLYLRGDERWDEIDILEFTR